MLKIRVNLKTFLIILIAFCHLQTEVESLRYIYPREIISLASLKHVKDILKYYGYPSEEYTIQTEDGYLLEIQRMPNVGGPPILFMHGLRGSAANWIMMGPWSDLAYLLHDHGYDVWLANTRGTRFGQKHISLQPEQAKFWNFSFHEIGLYDTSAAIDFVLRKSNYKHLSYVGHSQGAAVLYILTSLRPEYNQKILMMHAVAPAVYMRHLRSQFRTLVHYYLQKFEYPYYAKVAEINYSALCHSNIFLSQFCIRIFDAFYGPSEPDALNMTMTPVLLANFPETCSVRQVAHYSQIHKTDRFAHYDYDFNQEKRIVPSLYPLEQVSIPNAIYYCGDDYLVDTKDVKRLISELSNVIEVVFVQKCSHLDPLISTKARKLFHKRILDIDIKLRSKYKSMKKDLF